MRPEILNPLFADVATVKGIGEKLAKLMAIAKARKAAGATQAPDGITDLI